MIEENIKLTIDNVVKPSDDTKEYKNILSISIVKGSEDYRDTICIFSESDDESIWFELNKNQALFLSDILKRFSDLL